VSARASQKTRAGTTVVWLVGAGGHYFRSIFRANFGEEEGFVFVRPAYRKLVQCTVRVQSLLMSRLICGSGGGRVAKAEHNVRWTAAIRRERLQAELSSLEKQIELCPTNSADLAPHSLPYRTVQRIPCCGHK